MERTTRMTYFDDYGELSTEIVRRDSLATGEKVEGTCVIEDEDTTIVLQPGDRSHVSSDGSIVIEVGGGEL
jgi:N-methylhydantoinase A/oxoprolinase/acetone carboxylase beta subunit